MPRSSVCSPRGVLSKGNLVLGWQHPLMMPAMILAMLYHPHYYTHRMASLRTVLPRWHRRVQSM
jgi:hypothetical protein